MKFQLSLEIDCFVAFLSAELRITGGEESSVSLSITDCDCVYRGTMDAASADRLHELIVSTLRTYGRDESWDRGGLDGTIYRGSFRSSAFSLEEFKFWSPDPGTLPHRFACGALETVPLDHADVGFEGTLETMREDLAIGVPLRWVAGDRPCLRMIGRLMHRERRQLQFALSQAPATGDLTVDLSGLHFISSDNILELKPLAERVPSVTWVIAHDWQQEWLEPLGLKHGQIVKGGVR